MGSEGPSPLTRGRRTEGPRANRPEGPIPAHAGPPQAWRQGAWQTRAHPRSRGAASAPCHHPWLPRGPSPLTRGRRAQVMTPREELGPIPAHAGPPVQARCPRWRSWAHPRSRGAAPSFLSARPTHLGPSPLTRGRLTTSNSTLPAAGPIPAHAGPPSAAFSASVKSRAHPRSRGAARQLFHNGGGWQGPSPLTRGRRYCPNRTAGPPGPIPAHAGPPPRSSKTRSRRGAHPRSRGAAAALRFKKHRSQGPSPLTRGRLYSATHCHQSNF